MKTAILTVLMVLVTSTALAKDLNLVCQLGDIADLDIRIVSTGNNKATIKVKETAASGDEQIFYNSNALNVEIQDAIKAGQISAIVSKSNLERAFGGAYLHAGLLNMTWNSKNQTWDVLWSHSSIVMIAVCSKKNNYKRFP